MTVETEETEKVSLTDNLKARDGSVSKNLKIEHLMKQEFITAEYNLYSYHALEQVMVLK